MERPTIRPGASPQRTPHRALPQMVDPFAPCARPSPRHRL